MYKRVYSEIIVTEIVTFLPLAEGGNGKSGPKAVFSARGLE